MARRKKQTKKSSYRRRRSSMGAMGGGASLALYAVAGAAAAQLLGKVLPSSFDEKIKAAAPLALGFFLPRFVKGPVGQGLGAGMVAVGGLKLVQSFGVLNGIGAIADVANYSVPMIGASYNRAGLVDKMYTTPAIAGMDEIGC